jgi:hypothetical protein
MTEGSECCSENGLQDVQERCKQRDISAGSGRSLLVIEKQVADWDTETAALKQHQSAAGCGRMVQDAYRGDQESSAKLWYF